MNELDSRLIATGIVEALRAKGEVVHEITIESIGAGAAIRAALDGVDDPNKGHRVVECLVPAGYFAYAAVAEALIQAKGRCQLEVS